MKLLELQIICKIPKISEFYQRSFLCSKRKDFWFFDKNRREFSFYMAQYSVGQKSVLTKMRNKNRGNPDFTRFPLPKL